MIGKEIFTDCCTCTKYNMKNNFCDYYKKTKPESSPCDQYDKLILYPSDIKNDDEYFAEEFHETNIDKVIEKFLEGKN